MSFWEGFGEQLRQPHGWAGVLSGLLMRVVNREPNRRAIAALALRPAEDVLELGFGPGEAVRALTRLAPDGVVWGIDGSPTMLAQAQARNAAAVRDGRARLALGRFDRLPLPDASVDKVLAVNVVYFWGDGAAVLAEVWRVLRPGGRLCLYATDASTMRRWKFAGPDTHRLFDAADLAALLAQPPLERAAVEIRKIALPTGMVGLLAVVDKPAG